MFTLLSVLLMSAAVHISDGSLLASSEASLLGSLMHSAFLFDHMHDDYVRDSVLSHPYLARLPSSLESNATHENSIYDGNSIFNSTLLSRKRRTLAYDTDTKTLGFDVCIEDIKTFKKYKPKLDLEINFKIPVTQVFEDTFLNIEIPFNMAVDLFYITKEPCATKKWKDTIEPALSQIEEIISMLGVDGKGCVMKSICELAASPISRPEGIVGELLEVFFEYISNMEFATIEDIKDKVPKESKTDEDQNSKVEEDDDQDSNDQKKKDKQSLLKKKNNLENKKKSDKEMEKEPKSNEEESSFVEDPLLNSEEPLSKLGDLLQDIENQIKLERSKRDYLSAAIRGRSYADCKEYYTSCPISLFNLASQDDY